jgi:hypothetical protein
MLNQTLCKSVKITFWHIMAALMKKNRNELYGMHGWTGYDGSLYIA